MEVQVRKKFYGIEEQFDIWWNMEDGGCALSEKLTEYTCCNDPFGKRKRNKLVQIFNKYIKDNGLE